MTKPKIKIEDVQEIADSIYKEYEEKAMQTQRWLQDYRKEVSSTKEYKGREIFEMLQNADDAQSSEVKIAIDTKNNILEIQNNGEPFDTDGLKSIMLSNLSPKKGKQSLIGAKGLGFRSILNWAHYIEIHTEDLCLSFGDEIVRRKWLELRKRIDNYQKFEKEAKDDKREVPLAILAMPDIKKKDESVSGVQLVLKYEQGFEKAIKKNLKDFRQESLLFLSNLKKLTIVIDGKNYEYRKRKKSAEEFLIESPEGHNTWVVKTQIGKTKIKGGASKKYMATCAFCIEKQEEEYDIFSFFPTKTRLHLPCIVHATLELDSSRNSLVPDDADNFMMMEHIAEAVKEMATHLTATRHDWTAYKMMRPDKDETGDNEYIETLFDLLHKYNDLPIVPTVNGLYATEDDTYYYNDDLHDLIKDMPDVFGDMHTKDIPEYARHDLNKKDGNDKEHIEEYARNISDMNVLARFILALIAYYYKYNNSNTSLCLNILRDRDGNIIQQDERAYIYSGSDIGNIPSCRKMVFINDLLLQELLENADFLLNFSSTLDKIRELSRRLQAICNISSTDITNIKRMLVPKENDKEHVEDLLTALFEIFLSQPEDSAEKWTEDTRPYFMTTSGNWRQANELVMAEQRFPCTNELSFNHYSKTGRIAAYPDYLEKCEDCTPEKIQEFLHQWLGVHKYFTMQEKPYHNNYEYIKTLDDIPDDAKHNCWKEGQKNKALVADHEFLKTITDLGKLLEIIWASDYNKIIIEGQNIHYYYYNSYTKHTRKSFAAYMLKQIECVRQLQYYAIDDDEWIIGDGAGNLFENIERNRIYEYKQMLESLGAKHDIADFTSTELYKAINEMPKKYSEDHLGIQRRYHNIKQALSSKEIDEVPALKMLCRIGDKYEFRDSREIYYSDNDELPRDVQNQLPMLVMNRREGADIVKMVFGCRILKDITISISSQVDNPQLTENLDRSLYHLFPYILAFTMRSGGSKGGNANAMFKTAQNRLDSFRIHALRQARCDYRYNDELLYTGRETSENSLICTNNGYYICSPLQDIEHGRHNPRFIGEITNAICIHMRLSGSEAIDCFQRILTSNQAELEYYLEQQEIDEELWEKCQTAFGITEKEVEFWREVFMRNGITDFDETALREQHREYLRHLLPKNLNELLTIELFKKHHLEEMHHAAQKYSGSVRLHIYELLKDSDINSQSRYLEKLLWLSDNSSNEMERLERALGTNIYLFNPKYDNLVAAAIEEDFQFTPEKDVIPPYRIDKYIVGLDYFTFDDSLKSLSFFPGNEEVFSKLRKQYETDEISEDTMERVEQAEGNIPIEIKLARLEPVNQPIIRRNAPHTSQSGFTVITDRRKRQLGLQAEDAVKKALESKVISGEYEYFEAVSSISSQTGGNDMAGYDFRYKVCGEALERMLEVKFSDGHSFILSANEYRVAMQNRERYDIALYNGREINIIRAIFMDLSESDLHPNDYTVTFRIKESPTA